MKDTPRRMSEVNSYILLPRQNIKKDRKSMNKLHYLPIFTPQFWDSWDFTHTLPIFTHIYPYLPIFTHYIPIFTQYIPIFTHYIPIFTPYLPIFTPFWDVSPLDFAWFVPFFQILLDRSSLKDSAGDAWGKSLVEMHNLKQEAVFAKSHGHGLCVLKKNNGEVWGSMGKWGN